MKKLIFVYNADSGLFSSFADTIHKTVSPKTYDCNLCAITHGAFNMKKDWKDFIKSLGINVQFLHRDEFVKKFKKTHPFPCVFIQDNNTIKLLISSNDINSVKTITELKELIIKKIK